MDQKKVEKPWSWTSASVKTPKQPALIKQEIKLSFFFLSLKCLLNITKKNKNCEVYLQICVCECDPEARLRQDTLYPLSPLRMFARSAGLNQAARRQSAPPSALIGQFP